MIRGRRGGGSGGGAGVSLGNGERLRKVSGGSGGWNFYGSKGKKGCDVVRR